MPLVERNEVVETFPTRCSDQSFANRIGSRNGVAERFVRTARAECLDWIVARVHAGRVRPILRTPHAR
jgi:hypothetical protein